MEADGEPVGGRFINSSSSDPPSPSCMGKNTPSKDWKSCGSLRSTSGVLPKDSDATVGAELMEVS